jgi:toxin ParE1/3/4
MTRVNWTERALKALDGIYEHIHQEAPFYAQQVVHAIFSSVDRLEAFPLSGRWVPEAQREDVREVIYQHYRIIYAVISEERVDILHVLHGSRDLLHPDNQGWNKH